MKIVIITGSAGLIGSQACNFFSEKGYKVIGIDNDMRAYFFGEGSSTKDSLMSIKSHITDYEHYNVDIREYVELEKVFNKYSNNIELVIHTAAQPSHDWAAKEPLTDFGVNALGTMNMLELTRLYCPKSTFIFTSTNKVYGDRPNFLKLKEDETRWELDYEQYRQDVERDWYYDGIGYDASINEYLSIDNSKHSIFGASKVAADVMCQEYGKYFGMNVGIFRGGCLTGPNHAGAELHGFLSYLVKCMVHNKPYTIFGNGKNVRDNIHSSDLINMFWEFHKNPKKGEVYNVGGGRGNDVSIFEAIHKVNKLRLNDNLYEWVNYTVNPDKCRIGDHLWYITDLSKFKKDYPNWNIEIKIDEIIDEIYKFERNKLNE